MNELVHPNSHSYAGNTAEYLWMWCPGCDNLHQIVYARTDGGPVWTWNGSTESPTIEPSILVNQGRANPGRDVCHSFVWDGQWQFLSDCTHALAGQTVPMIPVAESKLVDFITT